jgi:hypothetical protein
MQKINRIVFLSVAQNKFVREAIGTISSSLDLHVLKVSHYQHTTDNPHKNSTCKPLDRLAAVPVSKMLQTVKSVMAPATKAVLPVQICRYSQITLFLDRISSFSDMCG